MNYDTDIFIIRKTINNESPLTLIAAETGASVRFSYPENISQSSCFYRKNNENWQEYNSNTEIILDNVNDYVQFKVKEEYIPIYQGINTNSYKFSLIKQIKLSGNIQSLLNYSNSCTPYCYYQTFLNCDSLIDANDLKLPATTLANNCYSNMFRNCTSLSAAPELPASEMVDSCYDYMFYGCTSLSSAPALPANILADRCYRHMFQRLYIIKFSTNIIY